MNREEALDKANAVVAEWLDAPKNQRGYPVDGWKPTSPTERAEIVVKIADFLWEPSKLTAPAPVQFTTLFGWRVGGDVRPTETQYKIAIGRRDAISDRSLIVTKAETDALAALIEAYEADQQHLHRASCHGAIGELQCGFPPGPTI